jgi:hypothetical protein
MRALLDHLPPSVWVPIISCACLALAAIGAWLLWRLEREERAHAQTRAAIRAQFRNAGKARKPALTVVVPAFRELRSDPEEFCKTRVLAR